MTRERELLLVALEWMYELKYELADSRNSGDRVLLELIADINKVEKILAQPEHTVGTNDMVEPVAWMWTNKEGHIFFENRGNPDHNWIPLYTSPPTREPLSKEQYMKFFTDTYDSVNPITDFVRAIEAAHGIGVDNNGN